MSSPLTAIEARPNVVVIGGGVAGLTVAYRLAGRVDQVLLIERETVPGGRARTLELPDGFFADYSAQFFGSSYRHTFRLMRELGIHDQLEEVDGRAFSGVLRDGKLSIVPDGVVGFARTRALSPREKLAVLRGASALAFGYRPGAMTDPSRLLRHDVIGLADAISARWGGDVLDAVVRPFLAMSMSDPEDVSLVFALSMLPLAWAKHYVFPRGNGHFARTLAEGCRALRLTASAARIRLERDRVVGVELADGRFVVARTVVCATAAHDAAPLLGDDPELSAFARSVPYGTGLHVLFGLERPVLPCWGVSIATSEGSFLSSITEETYKSRSRAPAGRGLLQAFSHGASARELLDLDDGRIADRVYAEARRLLPALPDRPLFSRVVRRPAAMVACAPGYFARLKRFQERVRRVVGLHCVSDYVANPLIEASVAAAERVAARIVAGP